MTEFDKKLNIELHKYKAESGMALYEIAQACNIHRKRLYSFTSGVRSLNAEDTARLMAYLNLTVELIEDKK